MIPYRVGDLWGYSDTSGKLLIQPAYLQADFFDEGAAFIQKDSSYYLINGKAQVLTEALSHYGKFVNGYCPVRNMSNRAYYINHSGQRVFDRYFTAAETFSEGLAVVSIRSKLGIIDTTGQWVREPDFDSSSVYFKSGYLLAKHNGRFVYINKRGNILHLPDSVKPAGIFSDGMAAVYVEYKRTENGNTQTQYHLQFIDTSGKIVLSKFVNDSMDYADYLNYEREFIDGKAIVNVANTLAYDRYFIDKKGKFSHVFSFAQHLGDSMFLGVIGYYLPSVRIYDSLYFVMGDFSEVLKSIGIFGDGLLQAQNRDGLWGYYDSNARLIIPFRYESANPFYKGYAIVVKNGKFGVINKRGKEFFRER